MLTPPKNGDRIRVAGRGCTKKLSDLLRETGVPRSARGGVAVLRDESGVAAVFGVGMAERLSAAPGDTAVRVSLTKQSEI